MKKTILTTIILCCAIQLVQAHDFAVANSDGVMIWYNNVSEKAGKNAVEVSFEGTWYGAFENEYTGIVDIPNNITNGGKTYAVIGIGEQAFSQCSNLKSVTIPESVEYIRDKAFENCYNVSMINYNAIRCADFTLPEYAPFSFGNMHIEGYKYEDADNPEEATSFWSAYKLRTVNIGASVERIPDYMFYGMGGTLLQVDLTQRTLKYEYSKEGVTKINFLGVPQEIGNQAFRACRLLRRITIPDGVQTIGQALFADCDTLATVSLPDYIKEIPAYFFMNCKELTNFAFPSQVESINYEAFKNCAKLTDLSNLPEGLKVIGPSAFRACQYITQMDLPEGLVTLDGYAFSDCTGLTTIDIPGTVETIGNYAFEDCTNLSTVTLHEGTKEIGNFVFAGCRKLAKGIVNAPARMPRIYAQTFQGVNNSMKVNVEGGNEEEYAADAYWGRFFAPQSVEEVKPTEQIKAHKIIRNGNVYILRDGKTFDILGNEFK